MKRGFMLLTLLAFMPSLMHADRDLYSGRHAGSGVSTASKKRNGTHHSSAVPRTGKTGAKSNSAAVQLGQLERETSRIESNSEPAKTKAPAAASNDGKSKNKSMSFTSHNRRTKRGSGRGPGRKGTGSSHHRGR
jgi:hypothetical protein